MAEQVLTDFIRALRSADVRVSTGEAIDAAEAVKLIGYADRQRLSDTLRCVLAKSPEEKLAHDRLFDLYFSRQPVPQSEPRAEDAETDDQDQDGPGDLLDLLESGDETAIAMAMERAGQEANLQDIRFSTQVSYYAQQMMKALGVERLEGEMMQAFRERTKDGQAYAEELIEGRKQMFSRAREHAKQAFETYGAGATLAFREDILAETALTALDVRDLGRMQALVQKLAKRLASKHSRRRRKKNRGQLDVRKTLRANAGFDGVPRACGLLHHGALSCDAITGLHMVLVVQLERGTGQHLRFGHRKPHAVGADQQPEGGPPRSCRITRGALQGCLILDDHPLSFRFFAGKLS